MRLIPILVALTACGGSYRTTRVLGDAEYIAFADRPSGGYAPMAPPDCAAGDPECKGQWLAEVHIGDRGGSIERVLQTPHGFQIYVRANADCAGDPAPNWVLMLRKPVAPVNVVQLSKPTRCDTAAR